MAFTVVPLHNLKLPPGTSIPFADVFVLRDIPDWLRKDQQILNSLSRHERESVLQAHHALVAEYPASAIGEPDPDWRGKDRKSIQETKFESAILANLAMWLRQPSSVCFTVGFDALCWPDPDRSEPLPIAQQIQRQDPLHCHPNDVGNIVEPTHLTKSAEIYTALLSVPRGNPVWEALRAVWAALASYSADRRYPFFWIGLEALFGASNPNEISYKLCQRIAFFLAKTPEDARSLFKRARNCYNTRSKIIHGRWEHDPAIDLVMADTEAIVRTALRHLLDDPRMLQTFISKRRDEFLEDWVFSRSTDPPPYPV